MLIARFNAYVFIYIHNNTIYFSDSKITQKNCIMSFKPYYDIDISKRLCETSKLYDTLSVNITIHNIDEIPVVSPYKCTEMIFDILDEIIFKGLL